MVHLAPIILLSCCAVCIHCAGIVTPGGWNCYGTFLNSVHLYSPFWNVSVKSHVYLHTARDTYISEALSSTEVLVAGGQTVGDPKILGSTEILNLHTGTVTQGPSLKTARRRAAHAKSNGVIYACGGGGLLSSETATALDSCEYYINGQWAELDVPMQEKREGAAMVAVDGGLLVMGGQINYKKKLNTTEFYSFESKTWKFLAQMKTERAHHGAAELDGWVYACGGWNDVATLLNSCEKYSFKESAWSSAPELTVGRAATNMVTFRGKLYMLGGAKKVEDLKSIEVYDPTAGKWKIEAQMSEAMCWTSSVVVYGC